MQQFSIRQVEQLSGIKAHTIRIWEKRYELIVPGRSDGKQRTYSNEDLKAILRIVYLYRKGLKISKIAGMPEKEIISTINKAIEEGTTTQQVMPALMEACIDLDAEKIDDIFDELESWMPFEEMMLNVVYPFLQIIGMAWMTSKIYPNNEHFVSHLVLKRIISHTEKLDKKRYGNKIIILFQPEGEYHEIPLLFINYLLQKKGCSTVYFGSNISTDSLEYYCSNKSASHIFYHLITNLGDIDAQTYLDKMSCIFPTKQIVISGPLCESLQANAPNVQVLKSHEALREFINGFDDVRN